MECSTARDNLLLYTSYAEYANQLERLDPDFRELRTFFSHTKEIGHHSDTNHRDPLRHLGHAFIADRENNTWTSEHVVIPAEGI
jgi:hypothetical protein